MPTDADKIAKSIATLGKSISSVEKAVAALSKQAPARTATASPASMSRELTEEEVDELRSLIASGDQLCASCERRSKMSDGSIDSSLVGMWRELAEMGFVSGIGTGDGGYLVVGVTSRGHWAVEKNDAMTRREALRLAEQRSHEFKVAGFGAAVGGLLGIVGTLLGTLIGKFVL